jgi:UDP-glucuronate 4-epimerase
MSEERFLVTGAMGCLGAWVVKLLLEEGVQVVSFDLSSNDSRLRLIATDSDVSRVTFVTGDITDTTAFVRAVADHGVTQIVHCAALQVPFVRADPALGARVNVVGTVNVFEAARRSRDTVVGLAYASSAAVFGPPDRYPDGTVTGDSRLYPEANLYGVFKQANEGTARIYSTELGIPSIGLRPFIVYGPGRDQGMTSGPTTAMVAAIVGRSYRIGFGGHIYLNLAQDTARALITAARRATSGARVLNVPGISVHVSDIVHAIEAQQPDAAGLITIAGDELPTPWIVDTSDTLAVLGPQETTPLAEGVARSMVALRDGIARGLVALPAE